MKVFHTLKPIYDKSSKVLILGSMPSVKSREVGFYYGHPRNRFWSTLSKVYNEEIKDTKDTKEDKVKFLIKHNIALFDVLKSCEITSSSDATIKNPVSNDLSDILKSSNIKAIFTTGTKAYTLYQKYIYPKTKIKAIPLPSTSPANSKKDIEEILINAYSQIKDYTD